MKLATGSKKRVYDWVRACAFDMNGMHTSPHLNALPLGSYSLLLGMDWLHFHMTKVDCYEKVIKCLDDDGEKRILQGKKNPTSMRMVIAMQAKHNCRKGCVLFVVHISSDKGKDVEDVEVLKRYPVLQLFEDVFPAEILKLSPHKEVDFFIELIPGATPESKAPYKMSTP